jgi:tetratricopeptide (TPR) repeat protein
MESNTVPRWTHYDAYIQLGLRLRYVIVRLAGSHTWDYNDRDEALRKQKAHGDKGILYADELAWLYNDIGLALSSEGSMADAYSLWEQGFEIDRVTDSEEEGGQYIVQSHLHMSHLFIELGRLRRAAQFLNTTERANAIYRDADFAGRIMGFRGLLAHLAGNLDEADQLYKNAIHRLAEEGRRNLRAESVFHRYWADLLIFRGKLEPAETHAELALSLAREGNFPDLEAYARKSRAHVWRDRNRQGSLGDPATVRVEYNVVMDLARKFGIKRLQADIHSELARLALDVGDWETARIRAMDSLMLANELSLGLRRTHALIVLGRAMDAAGNKQLAINYLQHAWALAQMQGYHLRGRDAEKLLQGLGAQTIADRK